MKTLPIIFISLLLLLFACNSDSDDANANLDIANYSSPTQENTLNLDIESNKEDIDSLIEWSNSMIEFSNAQSNTIEELTLEVQELKEKVIQLRGGAVPATEGSKQTNPPPVQPAPAPTQAPAKSESPAPNPLIAEYNGCSGLEDLIPKLALPGTATVAYWQVVQIGIDDGCNQVIEAVAKPENLKSEFR